MDKAFQIPQPEPSITALSAGLHGDARDLAADAAEAVDAHANSLPEAMSLTDKVGIGCAQG